MFLCDVAQILVTFILKQILHLFYHANQSSNWVKVVRLRSLLMDKCYKKCNLATFLVASYRS